MAYSLNSYGVKTSWRNADYLDARTGDIIEFDRPGYNHVGIADGRGGIYHFDGEPKSKSKAYIHYDKIRDVARGDKVRVNNEKDRDREPLPPREIIERAKQTVGKSRGTYDLTNNNCEHYATDMRYGEPESEQVSDFDKIDVVAGIGALVVVGAIGLYRLLSDDSDEEPGRGGGGGGRSQRGGGRGRVHAYANDPYRY